jgi:hypothetical protein
MAKTANGFTASTIGVAKVGQARIGRPDQASDNTRDSSAVQQELDLGDGAGGQPPTVGTTYPLDDQPESNPGEIRGEVVDVFKISKGWAVAVRTSSGGKWKAPVPPKYASAVAEGLIGIGSHAVLKKGFGFTSPDWAECVSLTGIPRADGSTPAFVSRGPAPFPHMPSFRQEVAVMTAEMLADILAGS